MKSLKILAVTLMLAFPGRLPAQEPVQLDLVSSRRMALEHAQSIRIADAQIARAQGERQAARAAWWPDVSASATAVYKKQEIREELYLPTQVFNPATGELVPNVAMNPMTGEPILGPDGNPVFNTYAYLPLDLTLNGIVLAGVTAQQPLYAGGRIDAGNRMARIGVDMAETNRLLREGEVIFATDQAFYQHLAVGEKVKLARQYKVLLDTLERTVSDSYELGMCNRNELLKVRVKRDEAALQVQKAETGHVLTRMALCRILGLDLDTPLAIRDSMETETEPWPGVDDLSPDSRLELLLLEKQSELAEQNIRLVRGEYLPAAGLSVGYNYLGVGLDGMDNFTNHGATLMANVQIPLVTFGERKGKVKAARARLDEKQLEMEQVRGYLQLEMEQARLQYRDALLRVELSRRALEQAEENMRISDDNYRLGMETVVDLLTARAEWQQAFSENLDALANRNIQESNLLRIANRLE